MCIDHVPTPPRPHRPSETLQSMVHRADTVPVDELEQSLETEMAALQRAMLFGDRVRQLVMVGILCQRVLTETLGISLDPESDGT